VALLTQSGGKPASQGQHSPFDLLDAGLMEQVESRAQPEHLRQRLEARLEAPGVGRETHVEREDAIQVEWVLDARPPDLANLARSLMNLTFTPRSARFGQGNTPAG